MLLTTQALFNVGFYAVVPFIAVVLRGDFGLGAAAVGLVLGARTFAQQGLFLVGGELADRFGARGVIALGCAPALPWLFLAACTLSSAALIRRVIRAGLPQLADPDTLEGTKGGK